MIQENYEKVKLIIDLYLNKKYSATQIAEQLYGKKCSYGIVLRILRKNNIKIRDFGDTRPRGKYKVNDDYFKEIDSEEKAYWLGFLYADGTMSYLNNKPSKVVFGLKDRQPVLDFRKAIESEHKLCDYQVYDKRTKKYYQRYVISITSKHFAWNLFNQGLIGKNNYAISFPAIKEKYISHFCRGLFDGDGCITKGSKNTQRIQFIGTSKICNFIQKYLHEKFKASINKQTLLSKNKSGELNVLLYYSKQDLTSIFNFLYKDSCENTRLDRKYQIYKKYIENLEHQNKNKILYKFVKEGEIIETKNLHEFAKQRNLTTNYLKGVWEKKRSHHKGWKRID